MIQLFPKKTKRPRRYIAKFDTHDLVTDSVRFPSGKSVQVTMEGWYWNNLDWINANTWTTEQTLAHMAENGRENYSFTQALKVAIWQFIDSYDRDVKARRDACQHGTH
jgi:predicted DNA-binding ribbon-helix-helix protein